MKSGDDNTKNIRRAVLATLLSVSAAALAACGGKEAETPTEETLLASAPVTAAAVTELPDETKEETKTPEEPETVTEGVPEGIPEEDFSYRIEKVMEYDLDGDLPVYSHGELSVMLSGAGYGAVDNAKGFLYAHLEPGERSNVQYSVVEDGEPMSDGEKAYLYEAAEFQCFSFPEIGIRSVCLPVRLHAEEEPAREKSETERVVEIGKEDFEGFYQCSSPFYPVSVCAYDTDLAMELYGDNWQDESWTGGEKPEGEMLRNYGVGVFGFENDRYAFEVSSKKTDLVPDGGTTYQMTAESLLNELWAWGTSQKLRDSGNVRILEKDGYQYVYIYSDSLAEDGSIVAQAWLFRVKDGISQGVSLMTHVTDDTEYFKLFDYVLNYSLQFYDMDTVQYDEGNMKTYGEALEAYRNGTGDDPGTGGYWLCEKFWGN